MMIEILLKVILGPFVVGSIMFYLSHSLTGVIAKAAAKGDEQRFSAIQAAYLDFMFSLKDIMALWGYGVITFIVLGWL